MPRQAAASRDFAANGSTRELIRPPSDLNELERIEFVAVVAGSPPAHFLPADIATISQYARAIVAERRAAGELDRAPVVSGPTGDRPSPWLPYWLGQLRACTTLARRLNINPAGRVASKPAEPEAPLSHWQRQKLLEGDDDDADPN
ncbi:hypothetical protein [Bradyrhizobium sp. RT4b]|uniref:hypothetical protein n=1 Tax=Bradyrhizobium sp. RT4b TaxID=3156379 RepID=UPI00339AB5E1